MEILEDVKQAVDEAVQILTNELFFYVEQIVLLLEQSSEGIMYQRILNYVGCIMKSQYQVKNILK